jgi:hypothetical protein
VIFTRTISMALWQRRLLHACSHRPHRRAAEECDELAPPNS